MSQFRFNKIAKTRRVFEIDLVVIQKTFKIMLLNKNKFILSEIST